MLPARLETCMLPGRLETCVGNNDKKTVDLIDLKNTHTRIIYISRFAIAVEAFSLISKCLPFAIPVEALRLISKRFPFGFS